jgi:hypothetical protein
LALSRRSSRLQSAISGCDPHDDTRCRDGEPPTSPPESHILRGTVTGGGPITRVTFTRSGGFAGTTLSAALDTATMSPDQARELDAKVAAADFFKLPPVIRGERDVPDSFQYEVTVETGDRRHTVRTGDRWAPERLRELLSYLVDAARAARRSG